MNLCFLCVGTLSPLDSFAVEMNVEFKNRTEGIASIDVKRQVCRLHLFQPSSCLQQLFQPTIIQP